VESLDSIAGQRVLAIAVSGDGKRAAWSADDGTLVVFSFEFGKEISRSKLPVARALAFSLDGRVLALGRDDKRLALVKADNGTLELESDPFDAAVTALTWLSANTVALGRADGTISAWDRSIKQVTTRWTGLPAVRVTALRVSNEGLLAGTDDGQVVAWSLEGGAPQLQFVSDSGSVGDVAVVESSLIYSGTDRLVHAIPLTQ
jgi:WD40 repeat protein